MKQSKEIINGLLIFFGISIYFLLMQAIDQADNFFLRFLNIFIVYFGVYRTIKANFKEGSFGYMKNLISSGFTALIGVALSFIGIIIYIYANGGQPFLDRLAPGFIFNGNPTVAEYCVGLFFEGLVSSVIIVFVSMQYWKGKTAMTD